MRLEGGAREGIGTPGSGKESGRKGRRKSLVLVLGPWYYYKTPLRDGQRSTVTSNGATARTRRRATLVDRLRDGQDDEQGHAVEKLAEWDDFGAHFGPPLDRIGIPACVFWTKIRSGF